MEGLFAAALRMWPQMPDSSHQELSGSGRAKGAASPRKPQQHNQHPTSIASAKTHPWRVFQAFIPTLGDTQVPPSA